MSLRRTLVVGLMAIAASLVVPVSASATTVTQPTGTKMSAGSLIKGTLIGSLVFTNLSSEEMWRCESAETTGEVISGGGAEQIASFNITGSTFGGTGTSGDCTSNTGAALRYTMGIAGGLPYCMKTVSGKDEFEMRGGKCAETPRSVKFTLDATGIGSCTYEFASLKGTFITDTSFSDAILTWTKAGPFKRVASEGLVSLFCGSEMTLDMSFTLEKDEATSSPLFIS
ncbi:MAG TPA: hypothetical protein VLC51_00545 [Nitrospira sp.]|nr:hypothetical protein [Nitrospira sp.]